MTDSDIEEQLWDSDSDDDFQLQDMSIGEIKSKRKSSGRLLRKLWLWMYNWRRKILVEAHR